MDALGRVDVCADRRNLLVENLNPSIVDIGHFLICASNTSNTKFWNLPDKARAVPRRPPDQGPGPCPFPGLDGQPHNRRGVRSGGDVGQRGDRVVVCIAIISMLTVGIEWGWLVGVPTFCWEKNISQILCAVYLMLRIFFGVFFHINLDSVWNMPISSQSLSRCGCIRPHANALLFSPPPPRKKTFVINLERSPLPPRKPEVPSM